MATKLIGSPSACQGFVFATGADGALHWKTQANSGDWSGWNKSVGPQKLISSPAAFGYQWGAGYWVYASAVGANGLLYAFVEQTGDAAEVPGWFGGNGVQVLPQPSSVYPEAMAVGKDGVLEVFDVLQIGEFPPQYVNLAGAQLTAGPAGAINSTGLMEIFAPGPEQMWHIWQTDPTHWSPWFSHGTAPFSGTLGQPAVAPSQNKSLEMVVIGSAGSLLRLEQAAAGGWSTWITHASPAGDLLQGSPALAQDSEQRLELFAITKAGNLAQIWQTAINGPWAAWFNHGHPGVPLQGSPAIALGWDQKLQTFAIGQDGNLYQIWQETPSGSWSALFNVGMPD